MLPVCVGTAVQLPLVAPVVFGRDVSAGMGRSGGCAETLGTHSSVPISEEDA